MSNKMKRFMSDYYADLGKQNIVKKVAGFNNSIGYMLYYYNNADRYPRNKTMNIRAESEFEEAEGLKSQICIQVLAFMDQTPFSSFCKGSVLESTFKNERDLEASYDEILVRHLNNKKLSEKKRKALNQSERVCAFRDYNRKTMVRKLKQDSEI